MKNAWKKRTATALAAMIAATALVSCDNSALLSDLAGSSLQGSSISSSATAGENSNNAGNANAGDNGGNAGNASGKRVVEVDACDLSGNRESDVMVDIGYGDREYWAYTNEHAQLVEVYAENIRLQEKSEENSKGRYCHDEAKVPGTEDSSFDEGHVIGDALGGVSNAYNITPQDSYLNRHGAQYQMERQIQKDGGAKNFHMIITYPHSETQTPSSYKLTYDRLNGEHVELEYANG